MILTYSKLPKLNKQRLYSVKPSDTNTNSYAQEKTIVAFACCKALTIISQEIPSLQHHYFSTYNFPTSFIQQFSLL